MNTFEDTIAMVKHTRRRDDRDIEAIRAFLYQAPNVMFLKNYSPDIDGVYVFVSREFERMFDVKREFAVGKTDFDIFPQAVAERRRLDDMHTLDFGRMTTMVDTGGTRYNAFRPYKLALLPITVGQEGKPSYLAGMMLPPLAAWTE